MKTIHSLLAAFIIFLISCSRDFCENAVCLNGGECFDGSCICTEGFTGTHCDEQKTPSLIRVRSVQVLRFPGSDTNNHWDINDGPDLYFRLYEGGRPLAQPVLAVNDALNGQAYYFFIDIIDLLNIRSEHKLELRDYDYEDEDDIMGSVTFIPYTDANGFPDKLIIDEGGSTAFVLELDYQFGKNFR